MVPGLAVALTFVVCQSIVPNPATQERELENVRKYVPAGMVSPVTTVVGKAMGTVTGVVRNGVAPVPTEFDRYAVMVTGTLPPLKIVAVMVTLENAVVVVQEAVGMDGLAPPVLLRPMQSLLPRLPVPECTMIVSA